MPGIFGFKQFNYDQGTRTEILIERMSKKLHHLESYKSDHYVHGRAGFGKIDVNSRFHSGVYVDSGAGIIVVLSGKIYDYIELNGNFCIKENCRPEEMIAKIYKKYHARTPEKLNGDFNVLIYDPQNDGLLIFNDRFGFRHLYIYEDPTIFMFAPEIKAFTSYSQFDKSLDEHGIADYFNFSYHLGNRTMFEKVKLLPPASCLVLKDNKSELKTYWEPKYKNERGLKDLTESIDTGYQLFVQSMERYVKNCQDVIIPLSGGLDSRLILTVAVELGCNVTTATFGVKGCLDYEIAKKVCDALNIDMSYLVTIQRNWIQEFANDVVKFNECNHSSLGLTTQHGFAKIMEQQYDCFLNGIFGGHLSFGSPYFNESDLVTVYSHKERTSRIMMGLNGHRFDIFLKNCVSSKLNDIVTEYREKTICEEWDRTENKSEVYAFRQDSLFLYNRIRRGMNVIDQNHFFYNDQRPFASYELYDFYLSLSPELTLNHHLYKEIYKKKLPSLARIPWQNTGVNLYQTPSRLKKTKKKIKRYLEWYLPRISRGRVNYLDKDNYEHLDANYRKNTKMRDWVGNILLGDECLGRRYFQKDGLMELLDSLRRGSGDFHETSKMLVFELWAQNFLD